MQNRLRHSAGVGTSLLANTGLSWQRYWIHQPECYELWKITGAGNLIGLNRGDILTITGTGLNAIYAMPDTAPYITRDTDYVFHKSDGSVSTACDGNRLIGYDFPKIIVKYLDIAPYTIDYVAILDTGQSVNNKMRDDFHLSIWWDNILSAHGVLKQNRGIGQSVWTAEPIPVPVSAAIANATPTKVDITFDVDLDATSVPATTTGTLAGKTISAVAVVGKVMTYTVTVAYAYGDVVTVSYTKPVSNYLKALDRGSAVASFSGLAVTNNIILTDLLYDTFTDIDGVHLHDHTMNTGPGWTTAGAGIWTISGNKATPPATAGTPHPIAYSDSGDADIDITLDVTVPNSNYFATGIAFRFQDATHLWYAIIERDGPGEVGTYQIVLNGIGGGSNNTVNVTFDALATKVLRVVALGNLITVYWDGVQKIQVTDTYNNDKTIHGLRAYTDANYVPCLVDNFKAIAV